MPQGPHGRAVRDACAVHLAQQLAELRVARKLNTTYEDFYWEVVYPSDPSFYPIYGDEYLRQSDLQAYGQPVYGGMEESVPIGSETSEYLMMNWGNGGQGMGAEYVPVDENAYWYLSGYGSYGGDKKIIHNFSFPTQ